ncbi:MAG TPA: outer membrane lipoprotein carrier protein LolA, partial [Polyangiaceae bacterium]
MKRLLLPLLAALLLSGTAAAADPPVATAVAPAAAGCLPTTPTADQAVACVQKVYDASQTFASQFSQKFWVKAYNQEKTSHGHVTFAKPGKMHWAYDDAQSNGNRVVSDGQVIKVYEANNKQMYEQP